MIAPCATQLVSGMPYCVRHVVHAWWSHGLWLDIGSYSRVSTMHACMVQCHPLHLKPYDKIVKGAVFGAITAPICTCVFLNVTKPLAGPPVDMHCFSTSALNRCCRRALAVSYRCLACAYAWPPASCTAVHWPLSVEAAARCSVKGMHAAHDVAMHAWRGACYAVACLPPSPSISPAAGPAPWRLRWHVARTHMRSCAHVPASRHSPAPGTVPWTTCCSPMLLLCRCSLPGACLPLHPSIIPPGAGGQLQALRHGAAATLTTTCITPHADRFAGW